ncbi:ring canal kelch homolog isoform X2 [Metopolophium dirhodum]|uniref:ring canal kelch homolog isoform X2 n=1 Tax=Metopolophium dirhodum TaxID=44670 RepID=UPI00298F7646|nr:ring canal kelch homolog isoform X2 [Metopolophium dirhodum]
MDSVKHVIPWKSGLKKVLKSNGCKPAIYINTCHTHNFFEVLQCLRKEEVSCDIKLKTDDGVIVCAHKVVLISASSYFRAMFTSFAEGDKYVVNIRDIDSNILQLLIDFIYTGKIMVTEQNVMVLLPAAIFFQLDYVKGVCVEFLQKQLNTSNCLDIKEFAEFYNCMELLSSSTEYIKKHFLKIVEADEFLSLSSEEVINLISRTDINVPFEEKIFECVINWVKHELDCRQDSLPKLMEHVRLSLAPQKYILKNVVNEPLIKNNPKCKDFVIEALNFHNKHPHITIPPTIRNSPRQTGLKFLLAMGDSSGIGKCSTNWYDPATKLLYTTIKMNMGCQLCGLVLIKDHLVFALSDKYSRLRSIQMLDLSSRSLQWKPIVDMLVDRGCFGVGVLDDRIYAIGGRISYHSTNCAEVFDVSVQEWRMISRMSTDRMDHGIGVLNKLIYAVGGYKYNKATLKSVECYDPTLDIWTPVTQMFTSRRQPGIGVLDGVMYAVGGECNDDNTSLGILKSVEAYSPITKVWSPITDMHLSRYNPIVTFNGLLYVIGGIDESINHLDSIEIYDPNNNTWTLDTLPTSEKGIYGAVVFNLPSHFRTD